MNVFIKGFSMEKGVETVLPILMLTGSNIVQTALATSAGIRSVRSPPVAYSFGWVSYMMSTMLAACKGQTLLPQPDCRSVLINAHTGYARDNKSWVLSRLLQDYSTRHRSTAGLTVVFLHATHTSSNGLGAVNKTFVISIVLVLLQFVISYIPAVTQGSYAVFWLTLSGTLVALAIKLLPQWAAEKWAARPAQPRKDVVCLTKGNGQNVVLVIVNEGHGFNLEDLAAGRVMNSSVTAPAICLLTLLSVTHLLAVGALLSNFWYIFAVFALGTVQNMIIASAQFSPQELGLSLIEETVVAEKKVFATLQAAEDVEPYVGLSLLPVYFPGGLRDNETEWVETRKSALRELSRVKGREYV
ncbi:hypothetical protein EIP86_008196 [Pleurotus ostreatoroseus]|nr:hypothetical protein EIP86_008196 [Pleurotus ostreatoroseus]